MKPARSLVGNLSRTAAAIERALHQDGDHPSLFNVADLHLETAMVVMRDGVALATDVYLPPYVPAPVITIRTPYGRTQERVVSILQWFACRGYAAVAQDCRGTGESEPDQWDYYIYEAEDSYDFVGWIKDQKWCDGFIASWGSSYEGQTQWAMATHPAMSAIAPEVSGLGLGRNTTRLHMFLNGYKRSVGKGADKLPIPYTEIEKHVLEETLSTGFYNDPIVESVPSVILDTYPQVRDMTIVDMRKWIWKEYCGLSCKNRARLLHSITGSTNISISEIEALPRVFGQAIAHDAYSLPYANHELVAKAIRAPHLMITGWYDWALNDALETWRCLTHNVRSRVAYNSRLVITPSAHNMPGYHEGDEVHSELKANHRANRVLLHRWYESVRKGRLDDWPKVIFYLMGANTWISSPSWPPPQSHTLVMYLHKGGALGREKPKQHVPADTYRYDPQDPTPTVGGSIVSYIYRPGSVDVSNVQLRDDVLTYTTEPLDENIDIVGPITLTLYVESTAVDTDFVGRLSEVYPDGRALQIQSGALRARFRDSLDAPTALRPGEIYRLEVDLWATAIRFKAGHRIRLDICSADFPRFDRNTNRAGMGSSPITARQTVYLDSEHPSHLRLSAMNKTLG